MLCHALVQLLNVAVSLPQLTVLGGYAMGAWTADVSLSFDGATIPLGTLCSALEDAGFAEEVLRGSNLPRAPLAVPSPRARTAIDALVNEAAFRVLRRGEVSCTCPLTRCPRLCDTVQLAVQPQWCTYSRG